MLQDNQAFYKTSMRDVHYHCAKRNQGLWYLLYNAYA